MFAYRHSSPEKGSVANTNFRLDMKLFEKNNTSPPWLTIGLCLGSLLFFLILGAAPESLIYSRQAIAQGEIWRLFTGHFVHCDFSHLSMNLIALLILGGLLEQQIGRKFSGVAAISCLGISSWLWFAKTDLQFYCGLSGMLNGLLVVLLVTLWRKNNHPILPFIAIASLLKIVIESTSQQAIFSNLSWAGVPGAHGAGLAAGITYLVITAAQGEIIPRT